MLSNKKILILTTTDNMIWQFLIPHIKELQKRNNIIECACAKTGFWFEELEKVHGFKMHEIDFTRNPITFKNLKGYIALKKLYKENKYDVVYCHQPVGGLMGRLLGRKFKVPVMYTSHGFHFYKNCPLKNKLLYKTAEKWMSKFTNTIVTINEEDFEAAKTFKAKKVYRINGIGVDTSKYKKEEFDHDEFRKQLGILKDDKVVLVVSEVNKNKNYETMINTMELLVKEDKKIKLIACGTGNRFQIIKQLIKEKGLENNFILLGYRKDVPKIIQISDILFHTSYREGLTLAITQAMLFGLPCVVSNVRGNRDLVEENNCGFLAEPTDYQSFAKYIKLLLTDDKLRKKIGEYNKEHAKKYTIDYVKEQFVPIYDEFEC